MSKLVASKLALLRNKSTPQPIFTQIKQNLSIAEMVILAKDNAVSPIFNKIWGTPVQKDISASSTDFTTLFTADAKTEFKFLITACIVHKDLIENFTKLKKEYEEFITFGHLHQAEDVLAKIEQNFGESLWSLNSRFYLQEKIIGTEGNWSQLAQVSRNKEDGILRFIIESISKRNESKILYNEYIKSTFDQINSFPFASELRQFLYFVTGLRDKVDIDSCPVIFYFYSRFPIVDRFVLISPILRLLYSSCTKEQFKPYLYQLKHLNHSFPDHLIVRNILICEKQLQIEKLTSGQKSAEFFERILKKNIKQAQQVLESMIVESFSIKHLVDAHVYLPNPNQCLLNCGVKEKSLINDLNKLIFDIVRKSEDFESSLYQAQKILLQIDDADYSSYFKYFVLRENILPFPTIHFDMNVLLGQNELTLDVLFSITSKDLNHIREKAIEEIRDFPLIFETYKSINNSERLLQLDSSNIDLKYLAGVACLKEGKLNEGTKLLKEVIEEDQSQFFKAWSIIEIIFEYSKANLYKELVILIGKTLMENANFLHRINLEAICDMLETERFQDVDEIIYTPIIFSKAGIDPHSIYIALDTYLGTIGISKPSDGLNLPQNLHNEVWFYLLSNVCVVEVMKYLTIFESIKNVEEERLIILKFLVQNTDFAREDVFAEMVELSQKEIIRKGISSYNKGKISLNVFSLRKYLIEKIAPSFGRFKLQNNFVQDSDYLSVDYEITDSNYNVVVDLQSLGQINTMVSLKDPSYISFKFILNEIRDVFLFSKEYGLDGSLSTRIRHGVLINHIKKVFFALNLLSTKDQGSYQDISIWNDLYENLGNARTKKIQDALKNFSEELDVYCNLLRSDYMQIRTEQNIEKTNHLFDFTLGRDSTMRLFAIARSVSVTIPEFVDFSISYFVASTLQQLEKIRTFFLEIVSPELRKQLDNLKLSIIEFLEDQAAPEILNNINQATTNITNELDVISKWFQLAEEDTNFELTQSEILQVALKLSNILYPHYQISPKVEEKNPIKINYSLGIVDVLKILLENVIIHSKTEADTCNMEIYTEFSKETKLLTFEISHNLGNLNLASLQETLDTYKANWDNVDFYGDKISFEGGSGLKKIKRLIEYELQLPGSFFDFRIVDRRLTTIIGFKILFLDE